MGWNRAKSGGLSAQALGQDLARYIRAARVDAALDVLAGPFGCRRFLLRFEHRGGRVRLRGLDAHPLAWGGGPPPDDRTGDATAGVEQALGRLHTNMSTGPRWERGAVAYVRDAQGRTQITAAFDHDADLMAIADLAVPGPPGHPLEDPATLDLFALHGRTMAQINAATRAIPPDWDWWEVDDDVRLTLHYDDPPAPSRHHRCQVLATYESRYSRFTWHTEPVGPAPVFASEPFASTFVAAFELGLLAASMVGAAWLMVQPYDDHDSQLMVAVFR